MSHCHDSHYHKSCCDSAHCHDTHCQKHCCDSAHCHDSHCHDIHCHNTCCDSHCNGEGCLHGPHIHGDHIVRHGHCHSPFSEVVTTTTNYTVPDSVVQYDTRTVSAGLLPQDPVITTVRKSSIRSIGHSHSRHSSRCSSRCSSRGSSHHHH